MGGDLLTDEYGTTGGMTPGGYGTGGMIPGVNSLGYGMSTGEYDMVDAGEYGLGGM